MTNQYAWDALGRLTSVTQTSQYGGNSVAAKLATYQYDAASELTDLRRYSSTSAYSMYLEVHSRMGYDGAGRLQSLTHAKSEIASGQMWNGTSTLPTSLQGGKLLAGYFLAYDQDNRLTGWSSYADAFKTTFAYDSRDQVTGATHAAIAGLTLPRALPAAESYAFDGTGNRNLSGGSSSSADGTFNRVQNDGTYTYDYDAEGNQIRRTKISDGKVTEYEYDYRNRLVKVTEKNSLAGAATKVVTYQYDAFDRRTGKQLDSDANGTVDRKTAWAWDGQQVVMQFVDADGAGAGAWKLTNRYLYGDAVDLVLADEQLPNGGIGLTSVSYTTGNVLWPLFDQLGSVRDVVDSNGVIRQHLVFDSFGNRLSETDYNTSGVVIPNNDPAAVDELFGYTGREWDSDVKLQYNRARWYDPAQGRWLSQDPIGFSAGDVNLYRYVGNGATGATDPSGLEEKQFPPRKRPPGTMADIISELHKDDASMRPIIEQRHEAIMRGKATGEAGQRTMADLGGFGAVIDGSEAFDGHNLLSTEGEELTTWERISRGFWTDVAILPFVDNCDDSLRAGRTASRIDDSAKIAHVARNNGKWGLIGLVKAGGTLDDTLRVYYTAIAKSPQMASAVERYNKIAKLLGQKSSASIDDIVKALGSDVTYSRIGHLRSGVFTQGKHPGTTKYWLQGNPTTAYGRRAGCHELTHIGAALNGQGDNVLHEIEVQLATTPENLVAFNVGFVVVIGGEVYWITSQ